jgi:isoleucyl-tRNA synthetase
VVVKLSGRHRAARPLSAEYDWKKIEARVRKFYDDPTARRGIARAVAGSKRLGYVEGPPTLNNQPHVGHVRGRMMKDLWYRHQTLLGRNVVFRGGWDTQGLPVELQAEKEMGLSGNKWEDLQKVGVEKLVEACKGLLDKYRRDWEEADRLLGVMIDHEKDYMTYRDAYIEREWRYLEVAWNRGLLGEGFKVVPYCPSCQTALSHAEVVEGGYEKLEDPSVYYKVKASDGSFLVVWTTMPFTVVTDELVGVKPEADYEFVRVGGEVWVVGSERKLALQRELGVEFGETEKKVKGRDLEGLAYEHPLLEIIPGLARVASSSKTQRVVAENFVDTSTGSGLVHMSPANGEDDFAVATRRGLPVFAPFDDQVKFTEDAGRFAGLFVRDADPRVVEALEERGALVKAGTLVHDYPVCWRSGHRLVWMARREYFYWVDRVRRELEKAARGVEYFFDAPRNRFLAFIAESPPWCITRERFWGTPLPVWVCEECGHKDGVFSRKEILERALVLPDGPDFELHRPWVDRVVLRCPECGGRAKREAFVLDTWHNSGSSPYASFTDREYRELVPVDFLTEGIDQTRGWAYTLLVLNVLLAGRPEAPYRKFLFQGHVLDEKGQKMSKSLGNVIQGLDLLRNNSADVSRFYITAKGSPEDSVSLDLKELAGRPYQVLNTLYHLHLYLLQNGAVDGYDPARHTVSWARGRRLLTTVDRWILSKLASAEKDAAQHYEAGRFNEAARVAEALVIGQLSQTYVRLVRNELWKDDPKERSRRLAVFGVLGHALKSADRLMHPVSPFVTEFLHQECFEARPWRRPLMASRRGAPSPRAAVDEGTVDFALRVEDACNSARTRAKLKRRWPLRTLELLVPAKSATVASRAKKTIALLCNVKEVRVQTSVGSFPATVVLRPNGSRVGALFKEKTRPIMEALRTLEGGAAVKAYFAGRPLKAATEAGPVEVPFSAFELSLHPREGYEATEKPGLMVALRTQRDSKLTAEGLVRDVARRLQALRKEKGFVPTAMLESASVAGLDQEDLDLLRPLAGEIAFLVRVKEVDLQPAPKARKEWKEDDLDGKPIFLDVG